MLSTLAYHEIFRYPLTLDEIDQLFIIDHHVDKDDIRKEIINLLKKNEIIQSGEYYQLPHAVLIDRRGRRKISVGKFDIARRAARIIARLPWVKLIAVTGALAMENADEHDDIDVMIVTSESRLWLVRPLVMVLVSLFFKRRRPNSAHLANVPNLANTVCLNLWLDETALAIPEHQRNLYTAHELAQMRPIVNKDQTYERIMSTNSWLKKYLANVPIASLRDPLKAGRGNLIDICLRRMNLLAFNLQFLYMKSKMTNERVSLHSAFFHPGNRARETLQKYDEKIAMMSLF